MAGYNRLEVSLWDMCAAVKRHMEMKGIKSIDYIRLRLDVVDADNNPGKHAIQVCLTGEAAKDDFVELAALGKDLPSSVGDLRIPEHGEVTDMRPEAE